MTRRGKIIRAILLSLAGLVVVLAIAAVWIVHTGWFRGYVRQQIISAATESTGGRTEIGSIAIDWSHLHASLSNLVIHGTEPAGSPPFLSIPQANVDLRVLTSIHHILNIESLEIDHPAVNVIVRPDGTTNVPTPPHQGSDRNATLQSLVNLEIGRFELRNGLVRYNSAVQEINLQGNDLHIRLAYHAVRRDYEGNLAFRPAYTAAGGAGPVNIALNIPLTIKSDQIAVQDATIVTPDSQLTVNGSVTNLNQPVTSARLTGRIALADLDSLGHLSLAVAPQSGLSEVLLDTSAQVSQDTISIRELHLRLGRSSIDASGTLEAPGSSGALDFTSNLDLPEIAKVMKLQQQVSGEVALQGKATLAGMNLQIDPLRVNAFGGELQGKLDLAQFEDYRIEAHLSGFSLQGLQRDIGRMPLPYSGILGGTLRADGNLHSSTPADASAALIIAPGRSGIPVSGNVNASYDAAAGELRAGNSTLRLPHTSATFQGSLRSGLRVNLTTRDLNDLLAAAPQSSPPPVKLAGGQASMQATISGSLKNPAVQAHLAMTQFAVEDRRFDSLAADLNANPSRASLANGLLRRAQMETRFAGSAGLKDWTPDQTAPVSLTADIQNGDLGDLMALAGRMSRGYSGNLTAGVNVSGTMADPTGSANVQIANGQAAGEPFDQAQAQVVLSNQLASIPSAFIRSGSAQVNLTAMYQHARDDFGTGHLSARVNSTPIDLTRIRTVDSKYPNSGGTLQIQAAVEGETQSKRPMPPFQITSLSGDVTAHGVRFEGQDYGDLTANASTAANTVRYTLTSNFAGSQIRANGRTALTLDYPTDLDASLSNLPVERVLAVARRTDVPARGVLAGNVHLSGTLEMPEGNAELNLANAVLYDEPIDRAQVRFQYLPASINVTQLTINAGPSQITASARFDHPLANFAQGTIEFQIQPSRIDLARIRNVQQRRPGLGGSIQMQAQGSFDLQQNSASRIALHDLNARLAASGIKAQGKDLGNLNLVADTSGGRLNFNLASNLANSSIQGRGSAQLSGDFAATANLNFNGVTWSNLRPLVGGPSSIDGATSGTVTLNGPLAKPERLNASVRLNQLEVRSTQPTAVPGQTIAIQNQGDIAVTLQNGQLRIESARLTGPQTDISASGTASLRDKSMDIKLDASANLALLRSFNPDTVASGTVSLTASAQGSFSDPNVTGRLELHGASVSYADAPLGIANANGVIALAGRTATIQNFTADSGGGKITLAGFVTRDQQLRFSLKANARGVRVHAQQGLDVVTTASFDLSGGTQNSLASGTVNLDRVSYLPQTDIASILTRSAPPVQSAGTSPALLANMKLDILVRTTSATAVRASEVENVQVISNLRIRGTLAQPGATGSIRLAQGKLAFFGATYSITTGTISFYDPNAIRPILNLALQTQAQGVTVSLNVTGPVDDLRLSYTSDPPLQFQEIVGLLAAGQTPTSDPTLLANAPPQASQTFQERGESAILGTALADPVANRLQRVFGVSQLKIAPSFTSGSELPQARVTLQQQVSPNIAFTYVTDLDNANQTEIRVQWSINPQWSAIADRDENGLVNVNLQYKKSFR